MRYVDSHCHLNMKEFSTILESVLQEARSAGILRLLVVGFDTASSAEALSIARIHHGEGVFAAVGVHPHDAKTCPSGNLPKALEDWVLEREVVAVGETGLDFHYDLSPRKAQEESFRRHIDLAARVGKPLIVHVREAYGEALQILREERADRCGGVIHCFSGEWQDAAAAMDLGFHVSFAGPVTFPRSTGLRETAGKIPANRLLCETDSPYLAPQPWRGRTNRPAYVTTVYETIAKERKVAVETLSEEVWRNAAGLFGWDGPDV
jgi:TatD DNase family protein